MKKGFTLIELLVVIAILAVLSTAIVLVLNPAELIRQARDSTRISDLATVNSAVSLWLADVSSTNWPSSATTTCSGFSGAGATSLAPGPNITTCTVNTSASNAGTGWINLNFTLVTGGAPMSRLPSDPLSASTSSMYIWRASTTIGMYEIDANMESVKYSTGGASDVESASKDGGNRDSWHEVGSALSEI